MLKFQHPAINKITERKKVFQMTESSRLSDFPTFRLPDFPASRLHTNSLEDYETQLN